MAIYIDGTNNYIGDTNNNELLKVTATASAVNELTLANAATAGKPSLTASGGDTNISVELIPKGTGGIAIGSGGTPIAKVLSATTTWDPADIATGAVTTTTVTVTGAAVGDPVFVGLTTLTTEDALLVGKVSAADTVEVVLLNHTGANMNLASGTLRAVVFKF